MPFRSLDTIESWLDEFRSKDYPVDGSIRVMPQDSDDGSDAGLVGVHLVNSPVVIYIQPESPASTRWAVTFESRESETILSSAEVLKLAAELTMVSALCAFLEAKSAAFAGHDGA